MARPCNCPRLHTFPGLSKPRFMPPSPFSVFHSPPFTPIGLLGVVRLQYAGRDMATSINKAVSEAFKGVVVPPNLNAVVRSMQLSPSFAEIAKGVQAIREQMVRSLAEIAKHQKVFAKYQQRLGIDWSKMRQGMLQFKAGLPQQLKTLADNGWFVSGNHTPLAVIFPLANMFQSGQAEQANQHMCALIEEHLQSTEDMLVDDFPHRAGILKKAFGALRARDYELSIPVMLAQADGIGREIIAAKIPKFSLTSKQEKFRNAIENFISNNAGGSLYTSDIFELILEDIPLNMSEGNAMLRPSVLNRNAILHGADTGYATELNALRAVSWIDYVSYFGAVVQLRKIAAHKS